MEENIVMSEQTGGQSDTDSTQQSDKIETLDIPNSIPNTQLTTENVSSHAEYRQQPDISQDALRRSAASEILEIRKLVQAGIVNPLQGQNLMNNVIQRAYDVITNQGGTATQQGIPNTEFFNRAGRSEVLDYLKKSNVVDRDEISRISSLVEKIEKAAVDDYLRKQNHEKTLNDENKAAKQRLRVNAQKQSSSESVRTVFTREQIGNMSGAEFAKYERSIMEQLRKGLIR